MFLLGQVASYLRVSLVRFWCERSGAFAIGRLGWRNEQKAQRSRAHRPEVRVPAPVDVGRHPRLPARRADRHRERGHPPAAAGSPEVGLEGAQVMLQLVPHDVAVEPAVARLLADVQALAEGSSSPRPLLLAIVAKADAEAAWALRTLARACDHDAIWALNILREHEAVVASPRPRPQLVYGGAA